MRGHLHFAILVLSHKPKLTTALDSQRRTPLHLASANGYLEMVHELVRAGGCDMCGFRDQDGLIPLHLAAMNQHMEVVKALIKANPEVTKEVGESILYMCVSYNCFEELKALMELWNEEEVAKITDDCGNTLLHAAAINKQTRILNYLLMKPSIKANQNVVNGLGLTALEVMDQCPRDLKALETQAILTKAGVLRANDLRPLHKPLQSMKKLSQIKRKGILSRMWSRYLNDDHNWLEKQRGILIVAALVVAAVAFHSGLNPPGGTFSDSQNGRYPLGNAVQTEVDMDNFSMFVTYNTFTMFHGHCSCVDKRIFTEQQVLDVVAYAWNTVRIGVYGGYLLAVIGDNVTRYVCESNERMDLFDLDDGLWDYRVDSYYFFPCLGGDEAVKVQDARE